MSSVPASYGQRRLWFIDRLEDGAFQYCMSRTTRLAGELDRRSLERAVEALAERHAAFRTRFIEADGEPVRVVDAVSRVVMPVERLEVPGRSEAAKALRAVMRRERMRPFDLQRGPLVRLLLLELGSHEHVLLRTMHHIVWDAWSERVFWRDLAACYEAFRAGATNPLQPLPPTPRAMATAGRGPSPEAAASRNLRYWIAQLQDLPETLALPTDRPRGARRSFECVPCETALTGDMVRALKQFGSSRGVTLYMILVAAFDVLLFRDTGQDDIVIGAPIADRRERSIDGEIGFFVNTLAIRSRLTRKMTFASLLAQVRATMLDAFEHQDCPFERLVEVLAPRRERHRAPLFQVTFTMQHAAAPAALAGVAVEDVGDDTARAWFDLEVLVREGRGTVSITWLHNADLFDPSRVESMARRYVTLLGRLIAEPDRSIGDVDSLSEVERAQVVRAWNATTAAYPDQANVATLIEAQMQATPDAVAVVVGEVNVSYRALEQRVAHVAAELRALGLGPDKRVAIHLERSLELVIGLLAVEWAGGAYVPLEPGYPSERLRYMIAESAPVALVTAGPLRPELSAIAGDLPVVDLLTSMATAAAPAVSPGVASPDHLAYVLYTSGSTGQPKGVMVPQRGVVNALTWMQHVYALSRTDAVLLKTPVSFDVSVWEFFWPFIAGARVVLAPPEGHKDPAYLVAAIERHAITTIQFVPSMLQEFVAAVPSGACRALRRILCIGETLSAPLTRRCQAQLPHATLHNLYGPTEASVAVTAAPAVVAPTTSVGIGRPMANVQIYVLDCHGAPAPVGVAGELSIGGIQVARGYQRRPALTAEKFVPDPFGATGARLYQTGDLARWRADGTLEFLGRTDLQVKIRGQRIELEEIEARLKTCDGVRDAVVVARAENGDPGDVRLIAYYTSDAALDATVLRQRLASALPTYMVPTSWMQLAAWPTNTNGKVDRGALPAPTTLTTSAPAYVPPIGAAETALAAIWSEVLGHDRIGRADDFFALGGHSLRAVRVVARVRQALKKQVSVGDVFAHPTLADLARATDAAAFAAPPSLDPAPRDVLPPLSFAQQRLWFLSQLPGVSEAYHIVWTVRLTGALDRSALRRALDRLVVRHDALRTTFLVVDGQPRQHIAPVEGASFALSEQDMRDVPDPGPVLERAVARAARRPFDFASGPLVRGLLVTEADDRYVLMIAMHHIVADAWSVGVLRDELSRIYGALVRNEADGLTAPRVRYGDYAAWQRQWIDDDVGRLHGEYWKTTLAGSPERLELPFDYPRPTEQDYCGARVPIILGEAQTRKLAAFSRHHNVTPFMVLLTAWAALLARLSGQRDLLIGTPVANRDRLELESVVGLFVNLLALRLDLSDSPTVAALLARVKATVLAAHAHQDFPFERVVELVRPVRSLAYHPLVQAVFAWQAARDETASFAGMDMTPGPPVPVVAKFDLLLSLCEASGRISGGIEYATALFDRTTVARYATYFCALLDAMMDDDAQAVDRISVLSSAERESLTGGSDLADTIQASAVCVHEQFEAQVRRTPDAIAVVFEDRSLTYDSLNRRANQLARYLRRLGVGPDSRVAICVERTVEMVLGIVAVLKAGGAYVPLDPAYPAERIGYMLDDSAPLVLLIQGEASPALAGMGAVIPVDISVPGPWHGENDTNLDRDAIGLEPHHTAYVIYTSGSSGRPKGVMVAHANLVRLFTTTEALFAFDADDIWTLFHSCAFDFSVWEMWGALLYGGRLVVVPREIARSPEDFHALVSRTHVTILNQTPSAFRQFVGAQTHDCAPYQLRYVIFGGEALEVAALKPWYARDRNRLTRLVNMYGITETTVHVTHRPLDPADIESRRSGSPIGACIPDLRAYILDAYREPVPIGVVGELYIGGAGVARGYLNRPALTAERFVPDPFGRAKGSRLYRTGDLGRRLADGSIEFLGRNDHQVKIRGYRIELEEITARLLEHPAVQGASVVARVGRTGETQLVAYYVVAPDDGARPTADVLRRYLGAALPEHMVPAAYVQLETLPVTPNGKLDRAALPAPEEGAFASHEYEAPIGKLEIALAEAWAKVLNRERVGRWDNFFELGGHSLLAMSLIERLRGAGVHIDVRALFATSSLAELAQTLEADATRSDQPTTVEIPPNAIPDDCDAIVPAMLPLVSLTQHEIAQIVANVPGGASNVQDIYPLAPLQMGILFHAQLDGLGDPYLLANQYSFDSRGRLDAYLAALKVVVARHDILRTAVMWEGLPEPVQVVCRRVTLPIEEIALDPQTTDAAGQLYERYHPSKYRMDVRVAPLLRVIVAHDQSQERWLLMHLLHHLAGDHVTLEVLQEEIAACLLGDEAQLPKRQPFRNLVAEACLRESADEDGAYFRQLLGDVDQPTAPFGLLDVRGEVARIEQVRVSLDPDLGRQLRRQARSLGVTAASVFHVAWALVLARLCGRDDVVFGTVLSGRMTSSGGRLDRGLGVFINTLPVRLNIAAAGAAVTVRQMQQQLAELLRHEHASLALAQRCSAVPPPAPLFSSLLNYRQSQTAPTSAASERATRGIRKLRADVRTNFPVAVSVDDLGDEFVLTGLVDRRVGARRVCTYLESALRGVVTALDRQPAGTLATLPVMQATEYAQLRAMGQMDGADAPTATGFPTWWSAQVRARPDAVAVVAIDGCLSYRALDHAARHVARHLRRLGVRAETRVAVFLPRGLGLLQVLVGVLHTGAAYVPLDPSTPTERLKSLLADMAPVAIVSQGALAERCAMSAPAVPMVDLERIPEAGVDDLAPLSEPPHPDQVAYVIYTSGSTGQPKGVMVAHRQLTSYVTAIDALLQLPPGSRCGWVSTAAADLGHTMLYPALLRGGCVHVVPAETAADAARFAQYAAAHQLEYLKITPSHLEALLGDDAAADVIPTRALVFGGESLHGGLVTRVRELKPACRIYNHYGPTECTVGAIAEEVTAVAAARPVPLGRPLAHARVAVVDAMGQFVPVGAVGEIWIGGAGVARGYWRQPALTAARFVSGPGGSDEGTRMYRTGDLGRWRADGLLDFLGRADRQVKIRGYRVELAEIESALRAHPAVRQVAVVVNDGDANPRLVAYVVPQGSGADPLADALRAHLMERLPDYMIPTVFLTIDALPVTPNGKVDTKALSTLDVDDVPRRDYEAPQGDVESAVACEWADALKLPRVGRHDNFFELGGHSLLVVRVVSRLRHSLKVDVTIGDLFRHPMLTSFAERIIDLQLEQLGGTLDDVIEIARSVQK
jgi:amino acid adenylation domain-containing protein